MIPPRKAIEYDRYEFKKWEHFNAETIVETPVSLTVNGQVWISFMCTPIHLEELAVGFLYNEGIIRSMDDVADVRVCEHGDNVDVWLEFAAEQPTNWRRTSGCTGGVTAVDLLAKPNISLAENSFQVQPEAIMEMVEKLFESQELYRDTGGVHTSALSDGEKVLLAADDIGRHNTLDKIAGMFNGPLGFQYGPIPRLCDNFIPDFPCIPKNLLFLLLCLQTNGFLVCFEIGNFKTGLVCCH
jgi:FdhD protein